MLKWFSTPLAPDQVLQRLRECVRDQEAEQSASKTEGATAPTETGARPVGASTLIGQVEGTRFRIRRAVQTPSVWWYLTPGPLFQPHLEGRVTLAQSGSRLETRGATPLLGSVGF
jgi:hypothetical protein